jgi:ADP-heptose:LPS heptosyltransferase
MKAGAAIVSDKQLGDVLLLQPSAQHLAQAWGHPTALFVREAFQPLIALMPGCAWGPEVNGKFSQVWTTNWSSKAVWQAFRLRTAERLLIINKPRHLRWWYRFLFHEVRLESAMNEYWARYFWRVVSGLPDVEFVPPKLNPPPTEWRHPQQPEGPFLLINPTAAWSRKFWGVKQWAETIAQLADRYSLPVVIAGGGSEREVAHCQAIADGSGTAVINLAGKTSMQQYLHLLSKARLVLCIDGAASHLAQAFDVPTVTVFGPTHEGKWHWPTPRHCVLAARHFVDPAEYGPKDKLSPEEVPTTAMLAEAMALMGGFVD